VRGILNGRIIVAGCFCLAIAGCGSSGASANPPKAKTTQAATATPRPTSVTPELTTYALLIQPVVRSGITQVATLINQMQKTAPSQLAKICVTSGGDLSNNRDAFTSIPPPTAAKKFYGAAKHAYSITLGATDECGIAADSDSASALAAAAKDLKKGLGELNTTQGTLAGWAAKH
jgi:hypothetical protein